LISKIVHEIKSKALEYAMYLHFSKCIATDNNIKKGLDLFMSFISTEE